MAEAPPEDMDNAENVTFPPSSPGNDFELPIAGFQGTPEEIEKQWFEQVYRGRGDSMAQLTWRAVLMGSLLGGVLSLTNLYIGLKSGWGFGVAITACILSYTIWTTLYKIGLAGTPMTILENNCMQSTASSAGYSTGGTLISAFAAYILIYHQTLPLHFMLAWVFLLAVLGVTMAIPMKRRMINIEQLRFPSGIAAAETLRALHSHGAQAARAAKALGIAGLLAAVNQFWADGFALIDKLKYLPFKLAPACITTWMDKLNERTLGQAWIDRTVVFAWDPIFIAAGALTGLRVCISMMVGGILCWAVFVPILQNKHIITVTGYDDLVQWTLWGGVSCMVASGLFSFAMQWRSMLAALGSLRRIFAGKKGRTPSEVDLLEAPMWWFLAGQIFSLIALAWLAHASLGMEYWQSTVAVLLTFFLALVACRVTGETDTTPVGAMGKVTQLIFGVLSPGHMNINLMSANITAGAATSSADLLTDLKSGYLLGANPRKQFLAQFAGIFTGTLVTVLCFRVLVPDYTVLGTRQFPAPSALTWKAVAEALGQGLGKPGLLGAWWFALAALQRHSVKAWSIVIGGLVGLLLPLLGKLFPKCEKWLPSAAGLGLAWTFPWYNTCQFFVGAVAAAIWEKTSRKTCAEFLFPVASGLIAGGSLMAVFVIFWENGPQIFNQLSQQFLHVVQQVLHRILGH